MIQPRVDGETRRGRDHVRVTVAMTIASADVAGALTEAWQALREAARDSPAAGTWPAQRPRSGLRSSDRDQVG